MPFNIASFRVLPVAEAVAQHLEGREVAAQLRAGGDIPFETWPRTLLPVIGSHRTVVCETDVPCGHPSPVHIMRWEDQEFETPFAPSIGALVTKWIDAIDTGNWTYDRQTGFWAVANPLRRDGSPHPALE